MEKEIYRQNLIKATQIAIKVSQKCIDNKIEASKLDYLKDIILIYEEDIELILKNPEIRKVSLRYYENDFFIYYNEDSGEDVEMFWKAINEEGLPFERKDIIGKILKKKKLSKHEDYEYIMDVIQPLYEEGKLTDEDVEKLNKLIDDFEKRG
mgnify:CR=1 FL=1